MILNVLWLGSGLGLRKARDGRRALAAALAPLLLWMWMAKRETGFWTGVDRLAPRTFPEGAAHWAGRPACRPT